MKDKIPNCFFLLVIFFVLPVGGHAQETSGSFGDGSVRIGYDNRTCIAGLTGAMRYNSSAGIEFCDGSSWIASSATPCTDDATIECLLEATRDNDDPEFLAENIADGVNILGVTGTLSGCTPNPACPNVGDVCDDSDGGTTNDPIFAGFMAYNDPNSADAGSCKALYVTNNDQSTSSAWKTSNGINDMPNESYGDGKLNDSQIPDSTTFPAFKLCKDLTDGGFTDWYLPAPVELNLLWINRVAINTNAAGNFTTSWYWSSWELPTTGHGRYIRFSDGVQSIDSKSDAYDIRCVRRD